MSQNLKDSGVPWLGKIPESWRIERGKAILQCIKRPVEEGSDVITCFRDGEVTLRKNRREEGFTFADKEIGYQGIRKGDLVVHGMDGFAGAIGISDSDGKASPVLVVCDSKENKNFLLYYLRVLAHQNVFLALSTGIRERSCDLRWQKLSVLPFPVPPKEEQDAIANFLDGKTAVANRMVENLKAQVEGLKRYKQSLISEVVTKGLNPNAKLKDSGVPWIGKVPEHWSLERLQWHVHEIVESNAGGKAQQVLSLTNQRGVIPYEEKGAQGNVAKENHLQYKVAYPGTIVANSMNILIGSVGISNYFGCVSPVYYVYQPNPGENLYFLNYLFQTERFQRNLRRYANGILEIRLRVSSSDILKRNIPVPPKEEQEAIVSYLDERCGVIDRLVALKEAKIEKITAYRQALVYECVTGKREVC